MSKNDRDACVYYCYAYDGTLLYVGQAEDVTARLAAHGHYSSPSANWFYYCTRVEHTAPMTRTEAMAVERSEIARLAPVFNTAHNSAPARWTPDAARRRAYGELPEIASLASAPTERRTA